ncbi:TPA: hypothetical protein N0F65_010944 [Lagenidium giganteum]|uniref:RNase H type-1 domain-containing protein n=1 Tax=Lagenidium giganteum TaxID=4803 RepID=A0AAV2Z0C2_9STRA|nr:TPA: hypothetical protein N0F65_010944 [Lagenidium giganteum]
MYIHFFDVGSRGNPGSGGSGATVVRRDITTSRSEVIWVGTRHYEGPVTNNVAEYGATKLGLRQALTAGLSPLHVVGMIIRQLTGRQPPKAAHWRLSYATVRRLWPVGIITTATTTRWLMRPLKLPWTRGSRRKCQVAMAAVVQRCDNDIAQWDRQQAVLVDATS